ncbi:MAG TPA: bifunctional riboflavin kinase/FAD synthetase [Bacilli bacterium]
MNVIRFQYPFSPEQLDIPATGQVLAVGFFDGVHRGHQKLLRDSVHLAKAKGIPASVLTFDPHPREVLRTVANAKYITPLAEKLRCFRELKLDRTYILAFDRGLSQLAPRAFIDKVIIPLRASHLVVGFNFTFGHLGRGTAETLREEAEGRYQVNVVRPFHVDGDRVSSTLIRELMHEGSIARVNELLGRPYRIVGRVVAGEGRGRTLGIPTANLRPTDPYFIPARGVYAVRAMHGDKRYEGVMNIGVKPTFHDTEAQALEVHLLDFSGDLYGEELKVEIIDRLRSERKFASAEALVKQIHEDIINARSALERPNSY